MAREAARSCLDCEGDGAFDVVGEDVEADFGSDVLEPSCFEVAASNPFLEGSEDVFDRSSPGSRRTGHVVEAGLHSLDDLFVFPALDAPFDAGNAVCLHGAAGAAGRGHIGVERHAVLDV